MSLRKPGSGDDSSETDSSSSTALATTTPLSRGRPRRASLRPEIRAALALEEAGELQEAARVFEYSGEHAQAALLRME
ncbi:MAG: hypothetical protein K0V04_01015, partial [Deltaproteobacteria bacterium]|nr:hypothetical protein [Deltaproteobacteria bacterium]